MSGGRPHKTCDRVAPAPLPSAKRLNRKKYVRQKVARGDREKRPEAPSRHGIEHRTCFRCRKREDWCRPHNCRPFRFVLPRCNLYSFLQDFDAPGSAMRRSTDCWDVQIMRQWAVAARQSYSMGTALMGLIGAAHFKSVRTWGVINTTIKQHIDWVQLRVLLARCGVLWGKNGSHAVYSASNMSGSGPPPACRTTRSSIPS